MRVDFDEQGEEKNNRNSRTWGRYLSILQILAQVSLSFSSCNVKRYSRLRIIRSPEGGGTLALTGPDCTKNSDNDLFTRKGEEKEEEEKKGEMAVEVDSCGRLLKGTRL